MATTSTGRVIYLPDPINQFNRLARVSGSKGTGSYVFGDPWNNFHENPATGRVEDYDNRNCTAAVGATLRDSHTSGRSRSNPAQIRNHQHDFAGGIGWDDVNVAWRDIWNEELGFPQFFDWLDVITALREGRDLGIQGDYGLVPWDYQAQKGGNFDHAFSLHGYRSSDGRVLFWDPLAKHMVWVPQYVIRPAAERLALQQRGSKGRLFVAFTRRVAPIVSPALHGWVASVHPIGKLPTRRYWQYVLSRDGKYIVDRIARETGGFTAECTAPIYRSVLSTSRGKKGMDEPGYNIVKLQTGVYDGRFIAAGYAEER